MDMEHDTIFISQPFGGEEESIRTRTLAIQYLQSQGAGPETDFLSGLMDSRNREINHAGENLLQGLSFSFGLMSRCNRFVFLPGWEDARGCKLEHQALVDYGYEDQIEHITEEQLQEFENARPVSAPVHVEDTMEELEEATSVPVSDSPRRTAKRYG